MKRGYDNSDERRYKRNRYHEEETPEEHLKNLIYMIGDNSFSSLADDIDALVKVIVRDYGEHKRIILRTIEACVSQLANKQQIYAMLVGSINVKNYEIGREIAKMLCDALEFQISDGKWEQVKLMIRFLGELVVVEFLETVAYVNLIEELVRVVCDDSMPLNGREFYAFSILMSLCWCAKSLASEDVDRIIAGIEQFVSSLESNNKLSRLFTQVMELKNRDWNSSLIRYELLDNENQKVKHELRPLRFSSIDVSVDYPGNREFLRLANDQQDPWYPENDSIERSIVLEIVWSLCSAFEINHRECVNVLMSRCSLDRKLNIQRAIVEAIFIDLLSTEPSFKPSYHAVLLVDLCRHSPKTIPKEIGGIIFSLFDSLEGLDSIALDRLSDWLAHHLSNFDFKWPWDEWNICLELDASDKRVVFLSQVFEKMIRLSYYERIVSSVPEEFKVFFPPAPLVQAPVDDNLPESLKEVADLLTTSLKAKKSSKDVFSILGNLDTVQDKRLLFIPALLTIGSKSYSHLLNAFERYLDVLQSLNSEKIDVLKHTFITCENHPQILEIVMDKLVAYRVVGPFNIVEWGLTMVPTHSRKYWLWRIIKKAFIKGQQRCKMASDDARGTLTVEFEEMKQLLMKCEYDNFTRDAIKDIILAK